MLEQKIEDLTKAVIALTELIGKIEAGKPERTIADITRDSLEIIEKGMEERIPYKEAAAIGRKHIPADLKFESPVTPIMPAAPTFEPVDAPVTSDCPITDGKSLIDFVMSRYKELGAEKGAQIQGVLTDMGLQNVNEVRATEYAEFYAKVMAL